MHDPWSPPKPTAVLVLADGSVLEGIGVGATGEAAGEICFNTAITGYQEILTDPSYGCQIVTFTFPHIGNVGANSEDLETVDIDRPNAAVGCVLRAPITQPSNYRSELHFDTWLKQRNIVGISGLDTRALTGHIRQNGMPNAVIAHSANGEFDLSGLTEMAAAWQGLENTDLAPAVTVHQETEWQQGAWIWDKGFTDRSGSEFRVAVIDFGVKRNILRLFAELNCKVSVYPADVKAETVLEGNPDGIFLSNGPGDPGATGIYAVPEIRKLIDSGKPIFGICLGHQMLALALGAKTKKMHQGHHGANHPVCDFTTGKVEITSMNHGFAVDENSLPPSVRETHRSLFDGSNCGLEVSGKPIFSIQHHPEASPGPQDSHYLFKTLHRFDGRYGLKPNLTREVY